MYVHRIIFLVYSSTSPGFVHTHLLAGETSLFRTVMGAVTRGERETKQNRSERTYPIVSCSWPTLTIRRLLVVEVVVEPETLLLLH